MVFCQPLSFMIMRSHDAAAGAGACGALHSAGGAIAAGAVGGDRVDGGALFQARMREYWVDVRGERAFESLRGHERIVVLLILRQRIAFYDEGLCVGTLEFDGETLTCKGDPEANAMFTRKYRAPFVVPEKV